MVLMSMLLEEVRYGSYVLKGKEVELGNCTPNHLTSSSIKYWNK